MQPKPIHCRLALACLLLGGLTFLPTAHAKERVQDFLDGLRQKGYYDIADQYLEGLRTNSAITEDIRQIIPYEQGRTLVDSAREMRDMPLRMKELDRAVLKFNEFIKNSPSHPSAAAAEMQLGNVLVERGRAALDMARKPANLAKKDELLKQSRDYFGEAKKVFDEAEKKFAEKVDKFPKFIDAKQEKEIEARNQALSDLIQSRLYVATVLYELAQSYDVGTPDHRKAMTASADKYKDVFEKYRKRLAGLYAGMWQARCYQEMAGAEDLKRALGIYDELLAQPDQPEEFRALKTKTLRLALEAWTLTKPPQLEEAVKKGEEWIAKARPNDERAPEGLGIRFYTAKALSMQADVLKKDTKTEAEAKRKQTALLAHVTFVAKLPGDYQQMAKDLLSKYRDLGDKEPATFAEARDRAKAALDSMQEQVAKIGLAPVTKEQAKIPEYEKAKVAARIEAIKYFNLALKLRGTEKEPPATDEVNVIRYFLTYLNYDAGNSLDAALLGEFLARRYPKSSGARPGAKIALASYLQWYNANKPNNQWETQKMVDIANHITKEWPNEKEADEAWMILGDIAIRENDLTRAAEYLAKIPEDSPRRGEADLKAGQAIWGSYLAANRVATDDPERLSQEKLDGLAKQAQETLERGVERMRKLVTDTNPITYTLLASELSLSQIYIGSAQSPKAVELLERAKDGPLALVKAKDEVVEKGNFPEETYKASLRAYVGAQQMDKAVEMMDALDARVRSKGGDEATLTKIYISLGRELGEQVEVLRDDPKKATELQSVLKGFEAFLSRISSREQGNTFSTLNWVGETFFNMADKLDDGSAVPAQAKTYYTNASETYKGMITRIQQKKIDPPSPDAITALEIRLAMCERRLGNYKEAIDRLQAILVKSPRMLEAQRQAAYSYQEWAEVKKDAGYYINAMGGGRKDKATGQNIIWGWAQMAAMTIRNPALNSAFHESRYNLAECRYKMAIGAKTSAEKADLLSRTVKDISYTYTLSPKMGGEEQYKKYDKLLKNVQRASNQKDTGLAGLEAAAKQHASAVKTTATTVGSNK